MKMGNGGDTSGNRKKYDTERLKLELSAKLCDMQRDHGDKNIPLSRFVRTSNFGLYHLKIIGHTFNSIKKALCLPHAEQKTDNFNGACGRKGSKQKVVNENIVLDMTPVRITSKDQECLSEKSDKCHGTFKTDVYRFRNGSKDWERICPECKKYNAESSPVNEGRYGVIL